MKRIDDYLFGDDPLRGRIVLAVDSLASDMTFSEMTVGSICQRAGVSRSTFYRYFRDKQECAEWVMHRCGVIGFGAIGRTVGWNDGLRITLLATKRLGRFFQALGQATDKNYQQRNEAFVAFHKDLFCETITRHKRERLDEDLEFILTYWLAALAECLNDWRIAGYAADVPTMARRIEAMVPPVLHEMLMD